MEETEEGARVKKTWPVTNQRSRGEPCEAKSEKGRKFPGKVKTRKFNGDKHQIWE